MNNLILIFILIIFLLSFNCNRFIYLENMRESMTEKELEDLTNPSKGFCETYRGKSHELEGECNKLMQYRCNTTDCCVWSNNSKCSAGGINGVTYKTDDDGNMITIDSYYYKNKCYGKCENV